MKKSDVVFKKLKRLFALSAAFLCLASCSVLSTSSGAPKLPSDGTQCTVGGVLHNAEFFARTAMPTTPTIKTYSVSATNGSVTKTGTVDTSVTPPTFFIQLPFGEWTFTAEALDSTNTLVLSDTKTITLNESSADINFSLKYIQNSAVNGNADLTIGYPTTAGISKIEWSLAKGVASRTTVTDVSSGSLSIQKELQPGAYNLIVYFYDASGAPIYRIDQIVNIYSNLTTSKFEGTAPYISGGNISIDATEINKFQITEFYVGGAGADDGNTGTAFDPFASVQKAIGKIKTINTGSTEYTIYVSGTVQAAANTPVASFSSFAGTGASVKIIGKGLDATLNGNGGNVVYVSTGEDKLTLTLQNLTITGGTSGTKGGGIDAESGVITVQDCKITGNETTSLGLGAGIYINNDAKLTITDSLISNNTSANNGGGVYNAGTLTLTSNAGITEFSGNSAATNGKGVFNNGTLKISKNVKFNFDDIYLEKDTSNLKTIIIEGNLTQDKVARITPAEYAADKTVLEDNSSGALVAANYTKFEVTPENRSGESISWEITPDGKLKEGILLVSPVYLDSTSGNDTSNGSESVPVKTLKQACKILDTAATPPTIIIMKPYTLVVDSSDETKDETSCLNFETETNTPLIQRYYKDSSTFCSGDLITISSGTVAIKNVTIDGNWKANGGTGTEQIADAGGSLLKISGATVTVGTDTTLKNNSTTTTNGGAIYNEAALNINSGEISGNEAQSGGAIYNDGTLNINGGTISGNTATSGGGIYNSYGKTLKINGIVLSGNTASTSSNGNGIYLVEASDFELAGTVQFEGNIYLHKSAPSSSLPPIKIGSGFALATGTTAINITPASYSNGTTILSAASDDLITDNYSKFKLLNADGTPCMEYILKPSGTTAVLAPNSTFYVNGSTGNDSNSGLSESAALKTVQAAIDKIAAVNDGETQFTIYVSGTITASAGYNILNITTLAKDLNLTISGLSSSTAEKSDILKGNNERVIYANPTTQKLTLKLNNLKITGGESSNGGGGIRIEGNTDFYMQDCVVSGNKAKGSNTGSGGGIFAVSNSTILEIKDSEISGNTAEYNGGGLVANSYLKGNAKITNTKILNNKATGNGGGIVSGNYLYVIDCSEFSGNTASGLGNGIYAGSGNIILDGVINISNEICFLTSPIYIASSDFSLKNSSATIPIVPTGFTVGATIVKGTDGYKISQSQCEAFNIVDTKYALTYDASKEGVLTSTTISTGGIAIEIPGLTGYTFEVSNTTPTYGSKVTLTVKKGSNAITADSYAMKLYNADDLEFLNLIASSTTNELIIPNEATLSLYPNKKYKLLLFATIDGIARESTAELTIGP